MNDPNINFVPSEQKILIVDDAPENIDILAETLADYKRMIATNGEKALKIAFGDSPPDIVLLDIEMPGIDGYEVCKRLKADESTESIPIIFLTGKTTKEDILKGFQLGAQDYVTKPFDTGEILARVKTHLELKISREKLASVNKWLEEKVAERTEQLEKANEELLKLDNAKAEFLQIISHEIRTPLNGILAPLTLLREKNENENLLTLIDILDISVARLEKFSLTALRITNLRTKNFKLSKNHVDMTDLIHRSLTDLEEEIQQKSIQIIRKFDEVPLVFLGEIELLELGMKNLLTNAIKYSNNGGEVRIITKKSGSEISCEISDNGPGFSEEALSKLFSLFSTGKNHMDKNMGIDLALVKMIIDVHEAKIHVSNNPDGGANVKLTFTEVVEE